jgi:hypothetical protein
MKMNRMDKSSSVKLWRLMLLGLFTVAPFVAESHAQSLPKPQLTITSITREPAPANAIFKSKAVLKWSVNIPSGVQIGGFHASGRRQSSLGSGQIRGGFPADARQGDIFLTEPSNVPVTLDLNFSASYTIPGFTAPIPDAQRSGNFPDPGVAIANGALDPPNPRLTIVKVERERINGYVAANSTATTPIKFSVRIALNPAFSGGSGGGAFGDSGAPGSSGFVLNGGQLELAITFNKSGKTQQITQPIGSSNGLFSFSVPRPIPGDEGKSFAVKTTGAKAELRLANSLLVSVTRQITV